MESLLTGTGILLREPPGLKPAHLIRLRRKGCFPEASDIEQNGGIVMTGHGEGREGFDRLYSENRKAVIRFLYRYIPDPGVREEIVQDVFLKVYERGMDVVPGDRRSLNLLFTMARNMAIDFLRREKRKARKYREIMLREVEMDDRFASRIEDCFIEGEVVATLHDTINSFPEEERRVFIEKNFFNRYGSEISCKYDISPYRIRRIECRINHRIRKRLGQFYPESPRSRRGG
jgi:RNA polymerase sigma-70 factor (ECF subfamily)